MGVKLRAIKETIREIISLIRGIKYSDEWWLIICGVIGYSVLWGLAILAIDAYHNIIITGGLAFFGVAWLTVFLNAARVIMRRKQKRR